MSDAFEYDVFLSFASADEEFVKPIWQEMSSSGLRVFWSDETLKQNIGQPLKVTCCFGARTRLKSPTYCYKV